MRIMILGAHGRLGHALQSQLKSENEILAFDRRLDVTDEKHVHETIGFAKPDIVVNCAGYTNVDIAEMEKDLAYAVNRDGARYVAEAAAELDVPVVYMSTDYVFDGKGDKPYTENDATNPLSVYGASKSAGEEAVRKANKKHFIVRTAWLFHTYGSNFLKYLMSQSKGGEVRAIDDQFGSPTYDPHLAVAIEALLKGGDYGTYHLAGRGGTSWLGLAQTFFRMMDLSITVRPMSAADLLRPAPRPRYSVLATGRKLLLPPWEQGVSDFASALKKEII